MKRIPGWIALWAFACGAGAARADTPSVTVHGMLDLVLSLNQHGTVVEENYYNLGSSNFDPYNARLFVEAVVGSGFEVFTQITLNESAGIEPFGAYVIWTPDPARDLHLEAGKIPMPVGTWAPRTYSNKNPLVGIPMMYQYHTTLRIDAVPPTADALLGTAGQGQYGPDYGSGSGYKGSPIVYDRCWDYGVMAIGSLRPLEFTLGMTYGTPGVPVAGPDYNDGKSVMGRIGLAPWPWLRFGVSGSVGPYLPEFLESFEPSLAGGDVDDFDQRLVMGDVELQMDHWELRAEGYANTWETPTVGDLDVNGGYVEAKATVVASLYVAGRYEIMRFSDLAGATLPEQPWDHDRDRWEVGAGYRAGRNAILKAVYQRNVERIPDADDVNRDITALQLALAF